MTSHDPTPPALKRCFYSLVRYVPDLAKGEVMNIGLLLHCPQDEYLGCLFTADMRRIRHFHPNADLSLLRALQQDFEQQIDRHEAQLEVYLETLRQTLSNLIQLAPSRSCLLADPQAQLVELFRRYVDSRSVPAPPLDTRVQIKQRLTAALVHSGAWQRLEKRVPASHWTVAGDPFTFDYGYRPNGVIKLIHALSLSRDTQLAKTLVYTLDRIRRRQPTALTAVVGGLSPDDEAAQAAGAILTDAGAELCPLDQVDALASRIQQEMLA
jgi:hypothetical protein